MDLYQIDYVPSSCSFLGGGFQGIETYAILVFYKALIVTADRNEEEKTVDVFEAVDPLLSFGPLATNIEHSVC